MLLKKLVNIFTKEVEAPKKAKTLPPVNPQRKSRRSHLLGGWRFFLFLAVGLVVIWWWAHGNVCGLPMKYQIGQVDERFGLSEQEMLSVVQDAERWWERNMGRNLFVYDSADKTALTINLVFDDRQQATQEMQRIEQEREGLEKELEEIAGEYQELKDIFGRREASIKELNDIYDSRLQTLDRTIKSWNSRGGAPPDIYDEIQQEQSVLRSLGEEINGLIAQQEQLANRINALADTETETVDGFNQGVLQFNDEFAAEENTEEEQGIYGSGTINVYQYDNRQDLVMLLAHEMGHALGLGHTEQPNSIMYPRKNERQKTGEVYISAESQDMLFNKCNL